MWEGERPPSEGQSEASPPLPQGRIFRQLLMGEILPFLSPFLRSYKAEVLSLPWPVNK